MSITPRRWTTQSPSTPASSANASGPFIDRRSKLTLRHSHPPRPPASLHPPRRAPYPTGPDTLFRRSRKLPRSMEYIMNPQPYSNGSDVDYTDHQSYLPGSDERNTGRVSYHSYPSETRYHTDAHQYDDPVFASYNETSASSSFPSLAPPYGLVPTATTHNAAHPAYTNGDRPSSISPTDPPDLFQNGYANYQDTTRISRPLLPNTFDVSGDYSMGPPIPYPSPATYATGLRSVDAFQTMPGHLHHPTSSSVPPPRYYHENGGNSPSHYDSIVDIQMSRVRNHISEPSNDFETFIRPFIHEYLNTQNRLALGERSVIVMSSKVAQKSYGAEKRFLCPPPTAILVGNSWWSEPSPRGRSGTLRPPKVIVRMSGENPPQESGLEWTDALGKVFDATDPPLKSTYIGRSVGKQLYISDAEEKKKTVEALVQVILPASDSEPEREIGTFPSSTIKVISKPAKRRQNAKNLSKNHELYISHGSTVSLFHRLRSQTVSTKYLCVSASSASFKGSDGKPLPGSDAHGVQSPTFIARTASWDPFVIYIVDVNKPVSGPSTDAPPAPLHPYFPSPPPNAINIHGGVTSPAVPTPVYYNQTVVLQCLTSGVVSPILIIRKLEAGTTVVGGGHQADLNGNGGGGNVPSNAYCPAGEVWGDPVSQLHKIAFEVFDDQIHRQNGSSSLHDSAGIGLSGQFLSCMGEKVNTYRPTEQRKWIPPPSLTTAPVSPSSERRSPSPASSVTNDGGRVAPKKARSAAGGANNKTTKTRKKRGRGSAGSDLSAGAEDGSASGAVWQVDIGETSVWTIVGTDQVRYDFYVPPVLFDQQQLASSSSLSSGLSFPAPSTPVTPFPAVVKYLPADRASEQVPRGHTRSLVAKPSEDTTKMITLYGQNFSADKPYEVYYGDHRSAAVEVRCPEVVGAMPPTAPPDEEGPRPILLVRSDGVIFPSNVMYP